MWVTEVGFSGRAHASTGSVPSENLVQRLNDFEREMVEKSEAALRERTRRNLFWFWRRFSPLTDADLLSLTCAALA